MREGKTPESLLERGLGRNNDLIFGDIEVLTSLLTPHG